jgi:hypothetical protein
MDAEVSRGHVGAKLSFTRLGFNYFISERVFDYILRAVHLVAEQGWRLLPQYRFDPFSGLWSHVAGPVGRRTSLRDISFAGDEPIGGDGVVATETEDALAGYLDEARRIFADAEIVGAPAEDPPLSPEFERIRWFPLPGEVRAAGTEERSDEQAGRPSSILDRSWRRGAGRTGTWRSGRSA